MPIMELVKSVVIAPRAAFLVVWFLIAVCGTPRAAQALSAEDALQQGISLYGAGRWGEAVVCLRQLQKATADYTLRAEASFWIAMAEINARSFADAIHDLDDIERTYPQSPRRFEAPYHKGRALYFLGRYAEALDQFKLYTESIRLDRLYNDPGGDYARKAAGYFWQGECNYALAHLDEAEKNYTVVTTNYRQSPKYESALNRLDMIRAKRVEKELAAQLEAKNAQSATARRLSLLKAQAVEVLDRLVTAANAYETYNTAPVGGYSSSYTYASPLVTAPLTNYQTTPQAVTTPSYSPQQTVPQTAPQTSTTQSSYYQPNDYATPPALPQQYALPPDEESSYSSSDYALPEDLPPDYGSLPQTYPSYSVPSPNGDYVTAPPNQIGGLGSGLEGEAW